MATPDVPACDSLYVAPHADDVLLACAGRLASESARGLRILVVTLFGDREAAPAGWPMAENVHHIGLGLPEAARRNPAYSSFRALVESRHPDDEPWLSKVAEALHDIGHRCRAAQVYVPLGVGSHIDHRLVHEAALRTFQSGEGRNVFLYEERPEALVRGAVRVRLGQVGARLPPEAVQSADRSALAPFLVRFSAASRLRGDLHGLGERIRATGSAARLWRQGRAWNPQRGFGPRLQPVVFAADMASVGPGAPAAGRTEASARRMASLAASYARRLGAAGAAERYWLLLPPRGEGGATLTPLEDALPL